MMDHPESSEKHTQIRKQQPKPSLHTQVKSYLTNRIRRRRRTWTSERQIPDRVFSVCDWGVSVWDLETRVYVRYLFFFSCLFVFKLHVDSWDTSSKAWAHMVLQLPHAEGGYGVTFNCGCQRIIFGTHPHGHHPHFYYFVTSTARFLRSMTTRRSVIRLSMMSLSCRGRLPSHSHRLTVSLRFPLFWMRTLTPMLTLLTSPHIIRLPNRSSATGNPSLTSNLFFRDRVALNS